MFVFSIKTSRRQVWSFLLCLAVLAVILLAALFWPAKTATRASATVAAGDDAARVAYLKSLGYEVDPSFCEVREVLIPDEFDEVFLAYNAMQQAADMDFAPYHGKRLKCWSYRLLNSGGNGEVRANLYIYKDKVVGGDISETVHGGKSTALLPRADT